MYFWELLRLAVLTAVIAAAVTDDFRRYKVSNKIIAAGFAGACMLTLTEGILKGGVGEYISGGAAGLVIMLAAYFIGAVGAGDVKLSCVCGILLGMTCVCEMIVWSFVLGGVTGLLGIIRGSCREKQCRGLKLHCIHFSAAMAAGCAAVILRRSIVGG